MHNQLMTCLCKLLQVLVKWEVYTSIIKKSDEYYSFMTSSGQKYIRILEYVFLQRREKDKHVRSTTQTH